MKAIRITGSLSLGAALILACTDRIGPTRFTGMNAATAGGQASQTSAVVDAVGDVKKNTPAWLDIASASITHKTGQFVFDVELAAPIPSDPALDPLVPKQIDHLGIAYALDTDSTTAPVGYPFGQNSRNPFEFFFGVFWNPTGSFGMGTGFVGLLFDRRPLLTGGQATITAIPISIQGNRVSVVLDAGALGGPATFAWAAFTELDMHVHPPDEWCCEDIVPDVSNKVPLATWPQ